MSSLLAVDLGIRSGLALYGDDARLRWYRSTNFGTAARLRRGAFAVLRDIPDLLWVILEGGGTLATHWQHAALRRGRACRLIAAEQWRRELLIPRAQRTGQTAKEAADDLARRVIAWSGAAKPTSLRHDAAEAILIGLWGILSVGWLEALPPSLAH